MDRLNYIERLKDALHDTDYKAIKHSEGWIEDTDYEEIRLQRQAIREEINRVEQMTEEEFYEAYPNEREEAPSEDTEPSEEPYDIDAVENEEMEGN